MSPADSKCPICGLDAPLAVISPRAQQDVDDVECKRCGMFAISPGHVSMTFNVGYVPEFLRVKGIGEYDVARASALLRSYLSIYTRECTERGTPPELLNLFDLSVLERLAATYSQTPISAKPDKVLRLLERRTDYPGKAAQFNAQLDYPAAHAIDAGEFAYYIHGLAQAGSIQTSDLRLLGPGSNYGTNLQATITLSGWTRLSPQGRTSRRAFVAMAFAADLNSAFHEGIGPAITESHYEPVRVDKIEHNEKICDRIVAEIRQSRFLIADVTLQRQGVYYEAGLADGLILPVIWSCRKDDLPNVHFDTRQYNHIVWETPGDLRTKLRDRISATIR